MQNILGKLVVCLQNVTMKIMVTQYIKYQKMQNDHSMDNTYLRIIRYVTNNRQLLNIRNKEIYQ